MRLCVSSERIDGRSARIVHGLEMLEPRRLLSGTLDKSFSGDGLLVGLPAVQDQGQITATVVQSDGKILVAGVSQVGNTDAGPTVDSIFVTRLNKDGSPDKSFDGDGTKLIPRTNETLPDMALTADGRIVLAAGSKLFKLMSSGKFDTTFGGGDGIAPITPFPRNDLEQAMMALRP